MSQDIKKRLRAYVVGGLWRAGLWPDDMTEAADRIEALERQLAEATKDRQRLTSDEADFERNTWTFHSDGNFRVSAGDYWIVPIAREIVEVEE